MNKAILLVFILLLPSSILYLKKVIKNIFLTIMEILMYIKLITFGGRYAGKIS
jgi:hypothetical protein